MAAKLPGRNKRLREQVPSQLTAPDPVLAGEGMLGGALFKSDVPATHDEASPVAYIHSEPPATSDAAPAALAPKAPANVETEGEGEEPALATPPPAEFLNTTVNLTPMQKQAIDLVAVLHRPARGPKKPSNSQVLRRVLQDWIDEGQPALRLEEDKPATIKVSVQVEEDTWRMLQIYGLRNGGGNLNSQGPLVRALLEEKISTEWAPLLNGSTLG